MTDRVTEPPLPYGRQWVDEEDIRAVVETLRSDYLTTGPAVARFEAALTDATGATYASAVNSGTSALHTAYFAAGLGAGDEIITSPLTFAATANAALYLGASVKFVDVQKDTGNLDPAGLEAALTERTKLVVPIDFAGHPADYDEINTFAKEHHLTVVADAAHSLGASYRGRKVGTLAAASELSFHPVKPVTTAEGGAVLTDDPEIDKRAKLFRTHGITKDPAEMEADAETEGGWFHEMQHLGFNYRLTDVQCALGLSQMGKLEPFIARRRRHRRHVRRRAGRPRPTHPPRSQKLCRARLAPLRCARGGQRCVVKPFLNVSARFGIGCSGALHPRPLPPLLPITGLSKGHPPRRRGLLRQGRIPAPLPANERRRCGLEH